MRDQVQGFLKFLETEKGYTPNTIAAYQTDLNQFLQSLQKDQEPQNIDSWAEVKKRTLTDYVDRISNSGEYAASSVARKVAAIKSFFHYLVAKGEIKEDPTYSLDSPKVRKRLPKAITPAEIDRLLQAPAAESGPKAQRDMALLEMLYASGMRVTELVSLNLSDVDLDPGKGATVRVKGKKANIKARIIPISASAAEVIKYYLNNGREQLAIDQNVEALFLNLRGQRLTRQGLWLIIKHYVEAVGISADVTPHTLRHSFAAHKLSQGQSLQDIQKLLGHTNIATTQVYAHLQQSRQEPQ